MHPYKQLGGSFPLAFLFALASVKNVWKLGMSMMGKTVLPGLGKRHDESLLIELVKSWANYKVVVRWLSRFFNYLDITQRFWSDLLP
ncbi:hypothetical protein IFM89_002910 [Coptis chinensis]|uniref:Uncharacterized protein n=1 Tax=Coptis chinensis TaxID=261450 RepID=A0A835IJA0_9MAGN|nr:hypothetical protein IFM89_002910 [Coptis chinensis]